MRFVVPAVVLVGILSILLVNLSASPRLLQHPGRGPGAGKQR